MSTTTIITTNIPTTTTTATINNNTDATTTTIAMNNNNNDITLSRKVKITLIGDNNVGRLSYLKSIIDGVNDFVPSANHPSVTVNLPHILDSDCRQFALELDCKVGNDRWNNRVWTSYRGAIAVYILFDVTDRLSFENVRSWFNECQRYTPEECIFVVVGNKADRYTERKVTYQEAKLLSDSIGALHYYETYVSNPHQKRIFETILVDVVASYDYYNYSAPNSPININRIRIPLSRSTNQLALSDHANLQMTKFRQVFGNRILTRHIFSMVSTIHRDRGYLKGGFSDNNFLCNHRYYEVFSYKISHSIPFTVSTSLSSFFQLLRNCTDANVTKHLISSLPKSELLGNAIKIADECVISGDINVVQWLLKEHDIRCSIQGLRYSVVMGNLDMVEFILEKLLKLKSKLKIENELQSISDRDYKKLIDLARSKNHFNIVNYLNNYTPTTQYSSFMNRLKLIIFKDK